MLQCGLICAILDVDRYTWLETHLTVARRLALPIFRLRDFRFERIYLLQSSQLRNASVNDLVPDIGDGRKKSGPC